jgi:integrase
MRADPARFGGTPLAAIRQPDVQAWVAELSARGFKPATVVKAYQLLGRTMTAALNADMVPRSPCRAVRLPKVEREEMQFLNPAEVARLADVIGSRYRALVLVAAYGGLRIGELAGLRRRRVDLLRGTVDVAEIVVEVRGELYMGPPKTRAGRRIAAELRDRLDAMHAQGLQAVPGGMVVELAGGPARPGAARRGPRRSKQTTRPGARPGLTWADWGAPPGTRTPNRCLKRAGRRGEARVGCLLSSYDVSLALLLTAAV